MIKKNLAILLLFLYLLLYAIIFITPLKSSKSDYLSGIFFSIILLAIFLIGVCSFRSKKKNICELDNAPISNRLYFVFSIVAFLSSFISINFYTGSTIDVIFSNILLGTSNYNEYQNFFQQNILGLPIHLKILGIASQVTTKFICLYFTFKYFIFDKEKNKFKLTMVLLMFVSYILFSLSRGTFFEIFEISIILMFVLFVKIKNIVKFLISKNILLVFCFAVVVLGMYQYNISLRYGEAEVDLCITRLICYDENFILPAIGKLLTKLMAYFGFPFLYMSQFLEEYMFYSLVNFVAVMLPFSSITADISPGFLCDASFDCGASWSPFIEKLIINFGLPFSFVIIFTIGFFYSMVLSVKKLGIYHLIFIYYIFLFVISLPINDFIYAVSSNTIIFTTSTIYVLWFKFRSNVKFN
jgi:hypothetical protein